MMPKANGVMQTDICIGFKQHTNFGLCSPMSRNRSHFVIADARPYNAACRAECVVQTVRNDDHVVCVLLPMKPLTIPST